MKVLLVEDDSFKFDIIEAYLKEKYSEIFILKAQSLFDAVKYIEECTFDLALVDMAIPSHTAVAGEGSPKSLLTGGIEVLLEMAYYNINAPCVVITQYPDIQISGITYTLEESKLILNENLECNVFTCVQFLENGFSWKKAIDLAIKEIK